VQTGYLSALAPEIIVCVSALLCLSTSMFRGRDAARWAKPIALLGLLAGLVATLVQGGEDIRLTGVTVDSFGWYVRLGFCGVGMLVVLAAWSLPAGDRVAEMFSLLLFSIAGAMLVAVANDLVLLFFALELVSVPTYVMVAAGSGTSEAKEAGLKYFFLGAMAAAVTAYGFSFLYGAAGSTAMLGGAAGNSIAESLRRTFADNPIALVGLVLAIIGVAYKMAAVPMHVYAADVYQGAAAAVAGMLSYVPKFAGLIAIIKLVGLIGWPLPTSLYWLLWAMAAATMTLGNTLALLQDNVKRMLAYSSIAHSGYILVGLLAGPGRLGQESGALNDGLAAALFYIVAYGIMNLGAFTVLAYLADRDAEPQSLAAIAGLGRRRPAVALALAVCVFGLLGMPPTAGFFGKVYIFGSALSLATASTHQVATVCLVVIALINAAVAAAYYLRIVGAAYVRDDSGQAWQAAARPVAVGLGLCAVLVLVIGLQPGRLVGPACKASRSIAAAQQRLRTPPAAPSPWLAETDHGPKAVASKP